MNINANFFLERYKEFLYIGTEDSPGSGKVKRWSAVKYTPSMKKRLGMAAPLIFQIPPGMVIFSISDFRFSIGNASLVAQTLKDVNIRQKYIYFDHTGSRDINDFRKKFSIPSILESGFEILPATTSQAKKAGYRFRVKIEDLILFASFIEKLRPEVSMTIRRVYFDKQPGSRTAMAKEVNRIGMQRKISNPQDMKLVQSLVKPLIGYKTKASGFSFRLYQLLGIAFWRASGFRSMIGDQMGISKTAQAIGCIKLAMDDPSISSPLPALVVAPSYSVLVQWKEAFEEWIPGLKVQMAVGGTKKAKVLPQANTVMLTTYDTMRISKKYFMDCGFKMVVFDESHNLKNIKSARTKVGIELGTKSQYVVLLTGTPMEKGVGDLWSQFHIIAPKKFPNPSIFLESLETYSLHDGKYWPTFYPSETNVIGDTQGLFARYVITKNTGGKQSFIMKPNIETGQDLRNALSAYMIRRLKSQVLDLPPKTRQIIKVPLDASGRKLYESYEQQAAKKIQQNRIDNYIKSIVSKTKQYISEGLRSSQAVSRAKKESQWLLEKANSGMDSMLMFMDLKRQIGMLKTAMVVTKLKDFIANTGGREPILVFAEQHRVIDAITNKMSKVKKPNGRPVVVKSFTGKVSQKERTKIKKDFTEGKIDILILNKAGNVGLNLQRASYVMFAERYWNPTDEEQAEDRAHRGKKTKPVTVFYIMIPDTIEDRVLATIDKKRAEIESTVGNQSYATSVKQQKINSRMMIQQLQKHFNAYIGKIRVPDKEIKEKLRQQGIRL